MIYNYIKYTLYTYTVGEPCGGQVDQDVRRQIAQDSKDLGGAVVQDDGDAQVAQVGHFAQVAQIAEVAQVAQVAESPGSWASRPRRAR